MSTVDLGSVSGGGAIEPAVGDDEEAADGSSPSRPDEYDPNTLDEFFGLLKNERRRRVVRYLDDVSPSTTLSDLAEHIAAVENDKPKQALWAQERKRVYIQLYQYHLPAMDKAGVITFDGDRGTVERTPVADRLTELLDADGPSSSALDRSPPSRGRQQSDGDRRPPGSGPRPSGPHDDGGAWVIYYLGLGLVGAGLFVFQWASALPALVGGAVVGVLLMAAVSCLLVRAARESASRHAADDGVSTSVPAPSADPGDTRHADRDRTPAGTGGPSPRDGPSPREWLETLLPSRTRRPIIEEPSSNGTTAGPVE